MSKSLYSSDAFPNVRVDETDGGSDMAGAEREMCAAAECAEPWCYLFVHHAKTAVVNERLRMEFNTFVHKTVIYKKKKSGVKKEERPTISGLVFVQGDCRRIQASLSRISPGLYLVNDCSTGRTAVIPDKVMRPFMQLARVSPNRIRFMSHPLDYYSAGHSLVRITSGILSGFEGYLVRISRDRCLVTSMGNISVAIGGVSKDTFEEAADFERWSEEQVPVRR